MRSEKAEHCVREIDSQLVAKIDAIFAEWDKPDSPGAALVVVKDGKVVQRRGYGCANLEYGIPIRPESIFHVASVSKQFTTMAIALLADEGKLDVDDDIRKYLPEVPNFGHTITIRHLAHHTSGLRDQWELLMLAGWRLDDVITREHIMKMVRHQEELNFVPGSEHLYSNTGYTLLAEIVSRVSGTSFREFAHQRIFLPLGMTNTHVHDDHEEIVPGRAYSYSPREGGGYKHSVLNYANAGATSLFTTVDDLARWLINFETQTVGSQRVHEQMHERYTLTNGIVIDYAFGLTHGKHKGIKWVGHSGGDAGYRSFCGRFPEHRLGVAILTNMSTFAPNMLAMRVAEVMLADYVVIEESPDSSTEPSATIAGATLEGHYLVPFLASVVTVLSEDGDVFFQAGSDPRTRAVRESGVTYRVRLLNNDARVTFNLRENGSVSHLAITVMGTTLVAKRLSDATLSQCQMDEYKGEYYSKQLGTVYTIGQRADGLYLLHRRLDDAPLVLISGDSFAAVRRGTPELTFTREERRVTGFTITGSRVRNVRFTKVS